MSVARNIADLIHTSGAVGIGTHSPSTLLEVNQDSSENLDIIFNNSRNQTTDRVRLVLSVDGGTTFQIENDQNLDKFKIRNNALGADVFNIFNSATHETLNITNVGVGIGTTGPDALLHVQHTSANKAFIVANRYNDSSTGSDFRPIFAVAEADPHSVGTTATVIGNHNRHIHIGSYFGVDGTTAAVGGLTVLSSGNVGIGASNPVSKLHVSGQTRLESSGEAGPHTYRDGNSGNDIRFFSTNGTLANPTAKTNGSAVGQIHFHGHDGTAYEQRASIMATVDSTPSTGNLPMRLTFWTGRQSNQERMRIDSLGNVGIGTGSNSINPRDVGATTLQIGGNGTRSAIKMHTSASGSGATDGMFIGYDSGHEFYLLNSEANSKLRLGTGTSPHRVTIDHSGLTLETQTVATLNSSATAGTIAYVSDDNGNLYYKYATGWKSFTASIGTSSNPATSGMQLAGQGYPDGYYYIAISGYSAQRMYVDNTRNGGGWLLMARVTVSSNQAHHNSSSVNVSGNNGPQYQATSTAKMSDAFMNAYRNASPYSGSTAYWMETTGGFTSSSGTILNNFIDTNATVDLVSSAQDQNARTRVATSFEGSLSDRNPNTGTRGFGDHHTAPSYFAYQRHPEQGSNSGFRNDSYGGSDGNLWIK
jgi:hypothetical protein